MKKLGALILTTFIAILLCSCNNGFNDDEESNNDQIVIDNVKSVEEKNTSDISQNNDESVTDNKSDEKDTDDLSRQNNELNKLEIIKKVEEMTDEEFLNRYINDLWIVDFDNESELSSDELFDFFLYSLWEGLDNEEIDDKWQYYSDKWCNNETGNFLINEEDITKQLNKYFKEYNFDISECDSYNPSTGKINIPIITGWGGCVFTKIRNKSIDYDINRVKLIVDYYQDQTYQKLKETKEYIFEFYNGGYFLIKCEKI